MRYPLTPVLIAIAVMSLCFIGCEGVGSGMSPANNTDMTGGEDSTTSDATPEDTTVDGEVIIPPINTSETVWCQPAPMAYDTSQLPTLPRGFDLGTFCDDGGLEAPEAVVTHQHTLDAEARVLNVSAAQFGMPDALQTRFEFGEAGQVQHIYVRGSSGFYSTGFGESWYDFNALGEVIYKLAVETTFEGEEPESAFEKDQVWDGDKLLSRTERDGEDGPILRHWTWTFDGDLLASATLTDTSNPEHERVWAASFEYHPSGALASVERHIDGVLIEREGWTFTEEGYLASRTFWSLSPSQLVEANGGEASDWMMSEALDTYHHPTQTFDYSGDPWARASFEARGDCVMLPRGPGHGYPDSEPEHQLGVARADRPGGIGAAYGNDSFGWIYGDQAWYGHDGIGSAWLASPLGGPADSIDVTVSYNTSGQMTSERATVSPFGDAVVEIDRTRLIVDGGITEDALLVTEGETEHQRTLRFERDANGLTARTLLVGGEAVERQTWSRDDQGRVLGHAIEQNTDWRGQAFAEEAWEWVIDGFGLGALAEKSWHWRFDGGLLVERGSGAELQTLRYDASGRLIEQTGAFSFDGGDVRQTWAFDEAGREVEQCMDYGDAGMNCTTTVYDAQGRLAWRETVAGDAAPNITELHHYECTP